MESFGVLVGQGNNKHVCVTAHDLIPDFNSLIIIQIRFPQKKKGGYITNVFWVY